MEPITIYDYAKHNEYIFIGKVISKNVTTDQTYYVFNVTEYLKRPLNSAQIYRTEYGGSEVAVSPSTFYYVNIEYIMFFDEIDDDYRILGNHVYYKLLNSVDTEIIEQIRQPIEVADSYDLREPSKTLIIAVIIYTAIALVTIILIYFVFRFLWNKLRKKKLVSSKERAPNK